MRQRERITASLLPLVPRPSLIPFSSSPWLKGAPRADLLPHLRLPDIGCASYIIGGDGECVVVDPRWDAVAQYVGLARRAGLEITAIVETHTHADHVSGATRLAERTGAPILIHRNAEARYSHRDLDDGDEIEAGPYRLQVLYTPGHSFDSVSLLVRDTTGDEPARLLTGDTLFVGDVGRPTCTRRPVARPSWPASCTTRSTSGCWRSTTPSRSTPATWPGRSAASASSRSRRRRSAASAAPTHR